MRLLEALIARVVSRSTIIVCRECGYHMRERLKWVDRPYPRRPDAGHYAWFLYCKHCDIWGTTGAGYDL